MQIYQYHCIIRADAHIEFIVIICPIVFSAPISDDYSNEYIEPSLTNVPTSGGRTNNRRLPQVDVVSIELYYTMNGIVYDQTLNDLFILMGSKISFNYNKNCACIKCSPAEEQ